MTVEVIPVSSSNPVKFVNLAKEELLKGRRELQQQLQTINEILSNMEQVELRSGRSVDSLPAVKPDEYRGMRAVDALESYLRARRGVRIPLATAIADLIEGGVSPGQPRGRNSDPAALISHTLKIALPNKRDMFCWEPDGFLKGVDYRNVTVWLADSADQPKRRKRKA